jgi:single-strand DNA-binding protein
MANLNKVLLIGRLTRDPELKHIPSGAAVAEFGLAVNRTYTQDGERKEDTCFLEVSAWGRTAEVVQNYLHKGSQVFVEGYLVFDEWQTQEGQKRSKIRVRALNVQFLDSARSDAGSSYQGGGSRTGQGGGSGRPADVPSRQVDDAPGRQTGGYGSQGSPNRPAEPTSGQGGRDTLEEECPF